MLPPPGYWKLFESEEKLHPSKVLVEAAKTHLQIEGEMLFNYERILQKIESIEAKKLVEELIQDESMHLETLAKIVKTV